MRGNNIKSNDARNALDALVAGRPVPVEHTPVFGCSTKWNSAIAGKQKEMKEWMARPVTLETVSPRRAEEAADQSDREIPDDQLLGDVVRSVPGRVSGAADDVLWYRSRDFEFVSVALNTPDEHASVQKFLDEHHSAVRNLIIDTDDVYAVQAAFDPKWESGVPFTLVLAPDGKEIYRVEGEADDPGPAPQGPRQPARRRPVRRQH